MQLQEVNGGEPLSVLSDDVRAAIMKNITRRMTPQPLKIRADVDMTCFAYDGVLHIQVSMHHFMDPYCKTVCIAQDGPPVGTEAPNMAHSGTEGSVVSALHHICRLCRSHLDSNTHYVQKLPLFIALFLLCRMQCEQQESLAQTTALFR